MSWNIRKNAFLVCLLTVHLLGRAGTPDGLSVLVISSESAKKYIPPIRSYFDDFDPDGADGNCEKGLLHISDVRFASASYNIPSKLAVEAMTDVQQRDRLTKALSSYRDKHLSRGFDTALIVDLAGNHVQLFGISSNPKLKTQKTELPVSALKVHSELKGAICHALRGLPVRTAP